MKLWIARDKDGKLFLYSREPILYGDYYDSNIGILFGELDNRIFPEVIFENSPQKVELKLCKSIEKVDIANKKHNLKIQFLCINK